MNFLGEINQLFLASISLQKVQKVAQIWWNLLDVYDVLAFLFVLIPVWKK